jgi:hypothetical protein
MAEDRRPRDQQETVHSPHRDDAPPKRSPSTVVWVTVAVAAVFVLGVALVVAAIGAA